MRLRMGYEFLEKLEVHIGGGCAGGSGCSSRSSSSNRVGSGYSIGDGIDSGLQCSNMNFTRK